MSWLCCFKVYWLLCLSKPQGLTLKKILLSARRLHLCVLSGRHSRQRLFPFNLLNDRFSYPRSRVSTAPYKMNLKLQFMSVLVFKVLTRAAVVLIVIGTEFLGILVPNSVQREQFLGTFAKLRKATISCVMSVRPFCLSACPSARMDLGSHWTDFHEIWYLSIFWKYVEKIYVSF